MGSDATFVIADNQDITRVGLHHFLTVMFQPCKAVDVVSKRELVKHLTDTEGRVDSVVILDYTLFDFRSADDFLVVNRRFPKTEWILFSNELSESFIRRMSLEDNVSMALKESSSEEIRSALLCAARKERFLCHQIANLLVSERQKSVVKGGLTPTELEVLKLIAQGKSVKEMAAARNSSFHTIITHKKNIFRKLGVNNVYEATKYALRAGIVELMEYYI